MGKFSDNKYFKVSITELAFDLQPFDFEFHLQ